MYKRRNLRYSVTVLAYLIIASLVLAACSAGGASNQEPTPTPLPTPQAASKPTYPVQRGDIQAQVQFSARIIPAIEEELYFRASGRVRKV